jgi:hypothetical protein
VFIMTKVRKGTPHHRTIRNSPETIDLLAWGYFAVAQRLRVQAQPSPPLEGTAGILSEPTLMADAPLVALRVSSAGHTVKAVLSHPGQSSMASTAIRFIRNHILECHLGPACGTPFHVQIVSNDGHVRWFSDPRSGLASINAARFQPISARWLYVDAYQWLPRIATTRFRPSFLDGIFINLGTTDGAELPEEVSKWRTFAGDRQCVIQVSIGTTDKSRANVKALSQSAVLQGADLAIVTAGSRGLAVASSHVASYATSSSVDCGLIKSDASGAGAAVSASMINALLSGTIEPDVLANSAAEAGSAQCTLPGSLSRDLSKEWTMMLSRAGSDYATTDGRR